MHFELVFRTSWCNHCRCARVCVWDKAPEVIPLPYRLLISTHSPLLCDAISPIYEDMHYYTHAAFQLEWDLHEFAFISEMQNKTCIIPTLLVQMPLLKEINITGSNNFTVRLCKWLGKVNTSKYKCHRTASHWYARTSNGDVLFCICNKLLPKQNLAALKWKFRLFVGTCFMVSPTRLHLNWAAAGQVLDIRPLFLRACPSGSSCGSERGSLRVRFLLSDRHRADLLHICVFLVNCSM